MKCNILSAVLLSIILLSCGSDSDCPGTMTLGKLALLPSSKEQFPYPETVKALIFTDSNGRSYRYEISENDEGSIPELFNGPCSLNKESFPLFSISQETRTIAFTSTRRRHIIEVSLGAKLNKDCPEEKQVADFLNIIFESWCNQMGCRREEVGGMDFVINLRDYTGEIPPELKFHPEIELNGKQYSNVFEKVMDEPDNKRRFYYQSELGVIGFTTSDGSSLYNLDRIE